MFPAERPSALRKPEIQIQCCWQRPDVLEAETLPQAEIHPQVPRIEAIAVPVEN
jgi:hypothetical protein